MTRRLGWGAVAFVCVVAAALISPPGPAAGASPVDRLAVGAGMLSIRIAEFEPAIPTPGDSLRVRGSVTNVSDEAVNSVAVTLRISPTPLVNRAEIPEVLAGEGRRTGVALPGSLVDVSDRLEPGESQDFRLDAEIDDLDLSATGVYVVGAEALGDTGSGALRQDLDRTFLPWWPSDEPGDPLLLTLLWPLVGPSLTDTRGVLLSEEPAAALSPGGRLSRLLNAAAAAPGAVTLVVDPEVPLSAAALAEGYRVRPPMGDPEPGTRSDEAGDWLARLQDALGAPAADATVTLTAWPDIDAVRRGRLMRRMLRQQEGIARQLAGVVGTDLRSTVILAPGGVAQEPTLAALARAQAGAIMLSDEARPLASPSFFTPSGNVVLATAQGELPGLLVDSQVAETLALPMGTVAERVAVRQALLAQTLATQRELAGTERLMIAAIDPMWTPPGGAPEVVISALTDAPWVTPTGVDAALRREPATLERVLVSPTVEDVALELPEGHVATVAEQYVGLGRYGEVVPDPELIPEVTSTAPTRLLNAWFRSQATPRVQLTRRVSAQIGGLVDSVSVVSSGSITVSGTSGAIPITVENLSPYPVSVGLILESNPPQLVVAEPVDPFMVEPGRRTSVVITAEVLAGGPIPVDAQLVTPTGRAFGQPGQLIVQSSAYANAARLLVRGALAALIITVAVHGFRRARRRRAADAARADRVDGASTGD